MELWARNDRSNFAYSHDFHGNCRDFFTCRKAATCGRRVYFPSEGRHVVEFFVRKIRRLRPVLNPRSWVPEASILTTRPPKVPEASMLTTRPPKVPEASMLTTRPPKVPEASMLTTRPPKVPEASM